VGGGRGGLVLMLWNGQPHFADDKLLRCRLFEAELQKQQEELRAKRMSQVGTGDRSEKIKTYNYKDSRCSDHRLKQNYDLNKQLDGEIEDNIQV
jgi:peptide chain release factor 1